MAQFSNPREGGSERRQNRNIYHRREEYPRNRDTYSHHDRRNTYVRDSRYRNTGYRRHYNEYESPFERRSIRSYDYDRMARRDSYPLPISYRRYRDDTRRMDYRDDNRKMDYRDEFRPYNNRRNGDFHRNQRRSYERRGHFGDVVPSKEELDNQLKSYMKGEMDDAKKE